MAQEPLGPRGGPRSVQVSISSFIMERRHKLLFGLKDTT